MTPILSNVNFLGPSCSWDPEDSVQSKQLKIAGNGLEPFSDVGVVLLLIRGAEFKLCPFGQQGLKSLERPEVNRAPLLAKDGNSHRGCDVGTPSEGLTMILD